MSALAILLTAAMTVSTNGPEKVPGELEQVLDLRGEWEGVSATVSGTVLPVSFSLRNGRLTVTAESGKVSFPVVFIDEGGGKLRMTATRFGKSVTYLGIFKWEKDRLHMCLGDERPTCYQASDRQFLHILHRGKSSK